MSAARNKKAHETGDAKMKAAAIRAVKPAEKPAAVPSPAKELQVQLEQHYQPLSRRMSVILVSMLVAFAFASGWVSGAGTVSFL
ncbi:MAG: hypothetical protein AAGJ68_09365 [Pseudomonadota bacterium]